MARTRAATLPHGSLGGGGGGDRLREGHHGELVVGPHERLRAAGGVQCVEWSVGLGQKPGGGEWGAKGGAAGSWVPAALFSALSWDTALGGVGAAMGSRFLWPSLGSGFGAAQPPGAPLLVQAAFFLLPAFFLQVLGHQLHLLLREHRVSHASRSGGTLVVAGLAPSAGGPGQHVPSCVEAPETL